MFDAAEIARLRADYYTDCRRDVEVRAILRDLDQAQKDAKDARALLEWAVELFETGKPITNPRGTLVCKQLAMKVRLRMASESTKA